MVLDDARNFYLMLNLSQLSNVCFNQQLCSHLSRTSAKYASYTFPFIPYGCDGGYSTAGLKQASVWHWSEPRWLAAVKTEPNVQNCAKIGHCSVSPSTTESRCFSSAECQLTGKTLNRQKLSNKKSLKWWKKEFHLNSLRSFFPRYTSLF